MSTEKQFALSRPRIQQLSEILTAIGHDSAVPDATPNLTDCTCNDSLVEWGEPLNGMNYM